MFSFLPTGRWIWKSLPLVSRILSFFGVPWNRFYALLLDRIERNNDISKVLEKGRLKSGGKKHRGLYDVDQGKHQLELLKVLGLNRRSKILELGLGYGRSAIPLIKYLNNGNYHGTEISNKRLIMCKEWVNLEGLTNKSPNLVLVSDNGLNEFNGHTFDFIWAQGVITHMPERELIKLLRSLKNVMKLDSKFIFNFGVTHSGNCINTNVKDFYYKPDYMLNLCRSEGYNVEEIESWHDHLHFGIDRNKNMALSLTLES